MAREMCPSNGRTSMIPGPAFLLFTFSSLPNIKPDGFTPSHFLTFLSQCHFFLNHTLGSKKRSLSFLGSSLDVSRQMFDLHHTVSHKCRAEGSAKSDLSIIRVKHVDPLMEILEARHFTLFYSLRCGWRLPYTVFRVRTSRS
ncbi:hypothetical protein E4T42_07421 [Aureobasidium subglaciale]|nr:hypothetical protein E4T42_07421 [Aureobasidium subglaciale]